ncbi:biotin--[acetyl-CoA-carboxylase] ligase [Roseospira navarrensis]|uniref:biotin--[biotin carboxyl-carrier protein] ligase n=1 Tax=Roseospira navarrensis TaxID=140058 RepID=A0A7X1ZB00_9PROT|nr:biotin--[acetyl-CoA-carboxylase] ligase [Roseospira navarrensis]MQX35088.1 biotin--[acetyl-CoA-carboxylase] ligase [Roseospira navarrensis]
MTCRAAAGDRTSGPLQVPAGWRLIALGAVDSTQTEALRALDVRANLDLWPTGVLVIQAAEQLGGRGRHGRTWASPPGNLYMTAAIPCPDGPRHGPEVGFVAGVAAARALGDAGVRGARLKWPNDVLVEGAKVAGLLPESVTDSLGRWWILLGLGINVAHAPPAGETLYPAVALADRPGGGPAPTVPALLSALLGRLCEGLALWRSDGFPPIRAAWLSHGHGVGEPVRVRLGAETITGVFQGLAPDGALHLRESESGRERVVLAGDVFFPGTAGDAGARGEEV